MGADNRPRLESLDVLRGLAVTGMILVVSPGDWSRTFPQLQHAVWNGATLADMVFPTFLFSVGVALGLSFPRDLSTAGTRAAFWGRVVRRSLVLIALGLFVEATYVWAISFGALAPGGGGLEHIRIPGILQRIGLCYFLSAALLALTGQKIADGRTDVRPGALALIIGLVWVGYWWLLTFVPVPGFGAGHLTPDGSLPAYIDRTVFTVPHLWPLGSATGSGPATYDPEGLLSSVPATTNVLLGVLAAWVWRRMPDKALGVITAAGVVSIALAFALNPLFPINKRIFTTTFALMSGGVSALALVGLTLGLRLRPAAMLATPFRVLGGNAILAFLLSTLMSRLASFAFVPAHGKAVTPQQWGNDIALSVLHDPYFASFACAVAVVTLITLVIWPLDRRGIHLRV